MNVHFRVTKAILLVQDRNFAESDGLTMTTAEENALKEAIGLSLKRDSNLASTDQVGYSGIDREEEVRPSQTNQSCSKC